MDTSYILLQYYISSEVLVPETISGSIQREHKILLLMHLLAGRAYVIVGA